MPPRARTDDWTSLEKPTTPLQRGAFLDACTAWLVAEPAWTDDAVEVLEHCTVPAMRPPRRHGGDVLAITHAEVFPLDDRACAFCGGNVDLRAIEANPFTQRCVVVVCVACLGR